MKRLFSLILVALTLMLTSCLATDVHEKIYEELTISYIGFDNKDNVTNDLGLKVESKLYPDAKISWKSSNESALKIDKNMGVIVRGQTDIVVTLTLVIDYNGDVKEFEYEITIKAQDVSDPSYVVDNLVIPRETKTNLELITEKDGVVLTWTSNNEEVISTTGVVTRQTEDVTVELVVVGEKDNKKVTKPFNVKVLGLNSQGGEVNFEEIFSLINLP